METSPQTSPAPDGRDTKSMCERQARAERGPSLHVPRSLRQEEQEGVLEEGTLQLQPDEKDT